MRGYFQHPFYHQYNIKAETCNNKTGDAYGLTVPRPIAMKFIDVKFTIEITDNSIIFKSGIDLKQLKREVKSIDFNELINEV